MQSAACVPQPPDPQRMGPDSRDVTPLPPIKRRINSNARRLRLRVAHQQIMLTLPPRTSEQQIQHFLQSAMPWLLRTWQQQSAALQPRTGEILHLPLLDQCFALILDDTRQPGSIQVVQNILYVHPQQASRLLKGWVRQQAGNCLPVRLQQLAGQFGFSYTSCQVRHANTRWGSCSARAAISLNAALMLLPVHLVDHVILHELCHTRQLNHSAKFWQQLAQVDAHYQLHRQQLKRIKLPAWWHAPQG